MNINSDYSLELNNLLSLCNRNVKVIVISILTFMILSAGWAVYNKPYWVVSTKLVKSSSGSDFTNYISRLKKIENINSLSDLGSSAVWFESFYEMFNLPESKHSFYNDNRFDNEDINQWSKRLIITKDNNSYIVSFKSDSADKSKSILEAYLIFVNKEVKNELYKKANSYKNIVVNELNEDISIEKNKAKNKLDLIIMKSELSYKVALAAGQEKPLLIHTKNDIFDTSLGYKGIEEEIKQLKEIKRSNELILISKRLNNLNLKLSSIKSSNIPKMINFMSYQQKGKYQGTDYPVTFNKAMFVLFGMFIGLIVGVGVALIRDNRKRK
ncbi:hypothetical protein [Photobacterium kishitanii]|uniref:hypothetical protein n=1 Tax=Photobacterium kishitanii TaxID=318456 RepID=UPI00043224DF|nr:hypothetical protein [Photobacterium kishitanii]CEO38448.1 hypothetical protein PPBDW_I20464 [Photobacterium kishitanii]